MRRRFVCAFVLSGLGVPAQSFADPTDATLAAEGLELRRAGRDAEALAVFERALAIDGSPRTRAQVALAEQALGLWVEAERDLFNALSHADDPWFSQHEAALQAALETIRSHLATLEVESNVDGAELWLNGAKRGVLPLPSPLRVVAGVLALEVRAAGFETEARSLDVAPKTESRLVVDLSKTPDEPRTQAPGAPAPPVSPPARSPGEGPSAGRERGPSAASGAGSGGARTAAWISLGTAVALSAGAGVLLLVRDLDAAAYNDDSRCYFGGLTRDQRCGGYRSTAMAAQTVGILAFEGAMAAAGVSVVLFSRGAGATTRRAAVVQCTLGRGVSCGASF
jgi:hypothetical protein